MVTYNHEQYVAEALESVLAQTYTDFDFIIVNDGSTDDTDAIIRRYTDPRITYLVQENQGVSAALNHGFRDAKGRYIAIMSGDDVCSPHRIMRQRDFLRDQRAQVATSWIEVIGDASEPLDNHDLLALCNCPPAGSRAEIARKLFWSGNYLWPSSAMIDRELFWQVGGFCLTSLQLQDFMLWIEIIKRTHIYTLTEPLLKYRVRTESTNLSRSPRFITRTGFEYQQIYRIFFTGFPAELFHEAFGEHLHDPAFTGEMAYAAERALLLLKHPAIYARQAGAESLFHLMRDERAVRLLTDYYRLSLPDFFALENDPAYHLPRQTDAAGIAPVQ